MRLTLICLALFSILLTGCSSSSTDTQKMKPNAALVTARNTNNPLAKYLELVGFRITETSPGKLAITFGVVNHSDADAGDVGMQVNIRTTASKPDDPPLFSFPAKVSGLGPNQIKEVTVDIPTKLRVYELPDWQFLRADFTLTSPQ